LGKAKKSQQKSRGGESVDSLEEEVKAQGVRRGQQKSQQSTSVVVVEAGDEE